MIKITNNVETIEVTKGAYESIYKRLGFKIIGGAKKAAPQKGQNDGGQGEGEGEDNFEKELLEKPISEWSKNEVKKFASINNIDISQTKNAGEAKEVIKAWISENK